MFFPSITHKKSASHKNMIKEPADDVWLSPNASFSIQILGLVVILPLALAPPTHPPTLPNDAES